MTTPTVTPPDVDPVAAKIVAEEMAKMPQAATSEQRKAFLAEFYAGEGDGDCTT